MTCVVCQKPILEGEPIGELVHRFPRRYFHMTCWWPEDSEYEEETLG